MLNYDLRIEVIHPNHSDVEIKKQSGDPQSGRIRCVCKSCNNHWMSILQNETKPILIPLLKGEKCSLTKKAQATLAAWCAMFTMVAEFKDRTGTKIGVLQEDRGWLKKHHTVPKNWKIWIADYERDKWQGYWWHSTLPILTEERLVKRTDMGFPLPNTQTTTFVVGKLYVHVLSSVVGQIVRKQDMVGGGKILFPRVWPIRKSPLSWPPPRAITDHEALSIATAFIDRARKTPPATV